MSSSSQEYQLACDQQAHSSSISFECFDTYNALTLYGVEDAPRLLLELRGLCLFFDDLWSFSKPQSDIARLNRSITEVEVHPMTAGLLRAACAFGREEPLFDVTAGALTYLWKHAETLPSRDDVAAALRHVGSSMLHIDGTIVSKEDPELKVDIGGVAKGYIADLLACRMRKEGVLCADIDLGGNVYLIGSHPSKRPWVFDVYVPEEVGSERIVFQAENTSVVTSGTYERYRWFEGYRYPHLLDLATGYPTQSEIVSATVLDSSSLQADLLSSVALLAGRKGIDALSARHPSSSFIAVFSDGEVFSAGVEIQTNVW